MAFGHLQAAALRVSDEAREHLETARIGRYHAETIRDLEREIASLQRENAMLRARADSAERKLAYMEQHYIPRAAVIVRSIR